MNLVCFWRLCGNFIVGDADDENAPVAELILYSPLRELAIDDPKLVAEEILKALAATPHPFGKSEESGSG